MVFDRKWFAEHQKGLLFLCNNFILKYWFRWVLRIHKDVSFRKKIYRLEPNCYTWETGKVNEIGIEFITDFRIDDKFSKRIYFAFWYLWATLHYFDSLFHYYGLELNFGFDTFHPDAHTETNSCDGYAYHYVDNSTWAIIRGGAGNGCADNANPLILGLIIAGYSSGRYSQISRGFCFFDTSTLNDSAVISSATISFYVTNVQNQFVNPLAINIYGTTATSTTGLANADYSKCGTTAFASNILLSNITNNAYNTWTLNSTGIANVSLTGLTRFSTREATRDAANLAPTWGNSYQGSVQVQSAEYTGNSQDPKLEITWSLPSTSKQYVY